MVILLRFKKVTVQLVFFMVRLVTVVILSQNFKELTQNEHILLLHKDIQQQHEHILRLH